MENNTKTVVHCDACDTSLGPKVIDNIRWGLWECNESGEPVAAFLEYDLRDAPESDMRMLVLPIDMAKWLIERWAVVAARTSLTL